MASGGNVKSSRLKSSKYLAKTCLDFVKKWVNKQAEIRKRLWFACPASFLVQDGGCVTKVYYTFCKFRSQLFSDLEKISFLPDISPTVAALF